MKTSTSLTLQKRRSASSQKAGHHDGTAERIVSSATRLFSSKGYDGTSVKDICDDAKVNIASVHYHFGSKEKLYRHIIEQFASERLEFARRTLQEPQNVDDFKVRLEIFLRQTLEVMIRQREIVRLIQQDAERSEPRSKKIYLDTLLKHAEKLFEFFDDAKKKGIMAAEIEPFSAAGLIMSTIIHQTRNDKLVKEFSGHSLSDESYRNRWVQQTLRIITGGIVAK